jgi:hypothetical protein
MSAEIEAALIEMIEERDQRVFDYARGQAPAAFGPRLFARQLIERVDELRIKEAGDRAVREAAERGKHDEQVLNALVATPGVDVWALAALCGRPMTVIEDSLERISALGFLRREESPRPTQPPIYFVSDRYAAMAAAPEEETKVIESVGYPRLERSADGRPIWDQGPLGMSTVLASIRLPEQWPESWPEPPLSDATASALIHEWHNEQGRR